jgi:hypothetical protein
MPDLRRVLLDYDLALLRLIAELWGFELHSGSQRDAQEELAAVLLQPPAVAAVTEALPPDARAALVQLARDGRQPLAQFTRRYGELRAMGPARRDRERPWANGATTAETLWYRALVGRAFFDDGRGPVEHIFIPDDLRPLIYVGHAGQPAGSPPGEPAAAPAAWDAQPNAAADDAVTVLAYLQVVGTRLEAGALPARHREALARFLRRPAALDLLLHLLQALGLVQAAPNAALKLEPEQVQPFLQAARPERIRRLAEAWRDSRDWNDLLHVPGLIFEGQAWRNDPVSARAAILALLRDVPGGTWWSLPSFVAAVHARQPDFQRPAGDYDSWYIRDAGTQTYLRGFANWDRVDGALVRYLIEGPLLWLGLADLDGAPRAFRLTPFGAALLGQAGWPEPEGEPPTLTFNAEGLMRLPASASGHDRFQLARISDWLPPDGDDYLFRLSPAALTRAAHKGITVPRILDFLQRAAGGPAAAQAQPAWEGLSGALRRWEGRGSEAVLREAAVLKLSNAELLDLLRGTPSVRDYLGEAVGPAAVLVKKDGLLALRAALAALGILVDE